MPIVDLQAPRLTDVLDTPKGFVVTPGEEEVNKGSDAPSWASSFGAAFRQDNTVGSFLSTGNTSQVRDDTFNPWDEIKGTKYEPQFSSFADVRNRQAFDTIRAKIDQETEDRKLLDSAPWYQSLISQGTAGALDLPSLIPGGAFVKGAKGGFSVAKSALSVGAAAGVSSAIQETALQNMQETRTAGESAVNIGASVLLGGLLGAGGAKLLSPGEWSSAVAKLESELATGAADIERGLSGSPASVGAAASEPATLADNAIAGRAASAVASSTAQLNPALRALTSPSAAYREEATKLFENSLYLKKNDAGVASEPAVETFMKEWNAGLATAVKNTEGAFSDYVKANGGGKMAEMAPGRFGLLTRSEFREEVGKAMRRGDESDNPHVAKVAKEWRAKVFDPLKEAAIEMKLLPADVSVETAQSYFSRMWNRQRLVAQEDRFKAIVQAWVERESPKWADQYDKGVERRLSPLQREIDELEMTKLRRGEELKQRRAGNFIPQSDKTYDVYHGSGAVFDEFDPAKLGTATEAPSAKEGFFFSKTPQTADSYTPKQYATKSEMPPEALARLVDLENQLAKEKEGTSTRSKIQKIEDQIQELRAANIVHEEGSNVRAVRVRMENPFVYDFKGSKYRDQSYAKLIAEAKAAGHDGVIFKNTFDGGPLDDIHVVFDQKQIGSRFETVPDTSEMTEGDIRQALRIVSGGAPKPKGVKTLSQFVLEAGGLVDDAGELAHRGITNKARPGLIRKERKTAQSSGGGWTLDDMARHAWENGYFPESSQRPSIDQFVEALNDDFHKVRAVLKHGEQDAYRLNELVAQLEADLARAGVGADGKAPRFSTSEEMKGAVERVYKALDAEADRKIAALKDRLNERQADARVERESRFIGDPKELSREIADEVFNSLTGRTSEGPRPEFITIKARGPLKERTFNIPDELIEDFLESDVDVVGRRYARVMGADVELSRKFGSVDLKDQIAKVREDYKALREQAKTEKERMVLDKREKSDIGDLEAMRDMLRGTDPTNKWDQDFSRMVRSVNHVNYLRSMGEVAIASLSETVRPAMVHGLLPYMKTIGQLATNLKGIKMSVAEAQLAGNVVERALGQRLATLSDIADPYASRGPVEAFLENMTNVASRWNGIRMLTDMQKSIAAVMTQNRVLQNVEAYGKIKPDEKRYLAYVGIDQSMAERIAKQFAEHGETVEGVRVAKTERWTDEVARRTYRAAINKDVDSIITTKGVADTPLFANTPTGRAMLQFKSFALASHQRVLLRGLQEDQTRFIGGLMAMSMIGMMATWLKAVSGNRMEKLQDIGKNPGWWLSEGLDRSGVFSVPMELANTFEKATGLNPVKTPLKAFDEGSAQSQRMQNRSLMGAIAGPSMGLVDDAGNVLGIPNKLRQGEEVTRGQKNAAERLLPFNSYVGMRQLLRYVINPDAARP